MSNMLISLGLLTIIAVAAGTLLVFLRYQSRRIDLLHGEVKYLKNTLNALCSGAVGVDRRVHRLERDGRYIAERQEDLAQQQTGTTPYGEAIRLVREGADVTRLVNELGISPNEADLIVMLHGVKEAS